ncbi:GNAT family N-acetyltransferase [Streptosporangiaceae bacterium NEAU-GS5]|nr:GNAT family N-acetyltransferase [Streptosporangiaceae bacterium NEAU-GS5]
MSGRSTRPCSTRPCRTAIRELRDLADVAAASGGDELAVWAVQGAGGALGPGVRAWALGGAVAVASPAASRRDRLALTCPDTSAIAGMWGEVRALAWFALRECGPDYRPLGDPALIEAITGDPADPADPAGAVVPGLTLSGRFTWMSTSRLTAGPSQGRWLAVSEYGEVARLLRAAHPSSYAMPGMAGVRRWAGIGDPESGRLLAVAADAWSAQTIGLIAGVATAVEARGSGLGERLCRFVAADLAARHGRVALMADDDNHAALGLYERLGFAARPVAAAAIRARP